MGTAAETVEGEINEGGGGSGVEKGGCGGGGGGGCSDLVPGLGRR